MIIFLNKSVSKPFLKLKEKYDQAINANQECIEAISISSYNISSQEVNSRYVNLKFIDNNEFIFFTNYNSPKSIEFESHHQIAATFYWASINLQMRLKAKIKKTPKDYNQNYFCNRSPEKNALSISSSQSESIDSYESIIEKYNKSLETDNLEECPDYWGGYSFTPYYFEFWEGHDLRLNKRYAYKKNGDDWDCFFLEP